MQGNFAPDKNLQCAALAGVLTTIGVHVLGRYGIEVTADESAGLVGFVTLLIAHAWDMLTGDNKSPPSGPA
jgi:hypothetical protein